MSTPSTDLYAIVARYHAPPAPGAGAARRGGLLPDCRGERPPSDPLRGSDDPPPRRR